MTHTPNRTRLIEHETLDAENFDLIAKITWLIRTYPGWSEDGTFTFPDGETWAKFDPEGKDNGTEDTE